MKKCCRCKAIQPVELFYVDRSAKDGLQSRCKPCAKDAGKLWAKNNHKRSLENSKRKYWAKRDYYLALNKKWCHENQDKRRLHRKIYNQRHPLRVAERRRLYALAHPEINRRAVKLWRQRNLERARHLINEWARKNREKRYASARQRYLKKSAYPKITIEQWNALKNQYLGLCYYCESEEKLTMDHVIPLSRGGSHSIDNIVPACGKCNSKKGNFLQGEYLKRLDAELEQARKLAGVR